jgi:aminoglycoside 2''-phosphotransferase
MSNESDNWHKRITEIRPDLAIEQIELNQDGLINDVVIVNGELVFRFAKTDAYSDLMEREMHVLELVRPRVPVSIPDPIHYERGCMVYPLLPGQPLLLEDIRRMDEADQQRMADQLGAFLHALHTTPLSEAGQEVPPTVAPATRERIVDLRDRVREKVYPLLLPHQVQWVEALYADVLDDGHALDYEPALVHADLAPYHVLYDADSRRITGVLDFGTAGVGDPAQDVMISAYGERFLARMADVYPGLDALMPRARFRAQEIELQWVLLGIETGEPFWFTAHIGGARDLLG